jgi:hypothetical protein
MKWIIIPEQKEEMMRTAFRSGRGGQRNSSAPASPATNGNVTNRPEEMNIPSSVPRPRRSPTPLLTPYQSHSAYTPDRAPQLPPNHAIQGRLDNGSPLPRRTREPGSTFGLSDNVQGSPPVLSSSYLPEDSGSFVTPAPNRVHPRLAPPSTAQRPSQYMPTSSPAPFWKFVDSNMGNTPLRTLDLEESPIKGGALRGGVASSSPPPVRAGGESPTRPARGEGVKIESIGAGADLDEEDGLQIDLTR